jgi:Mg-chelatase subunit ChlD
VCSLPRRTSSAIRRALVLLTLAAAAQGCEEERPAPPVARQQPADAPPRNPIEEILTSDPPVERRLEGTAVMVLVDSSGSMADSVLDAKGEPRPKITIARRCVLSLVRQAEQFAKKNTAVPVQLGILEFSSREHEPSSRQVLPLGAPNEGIAHNFLARIVPKGGTPIGDAIIEAKKQLDQSGLRRLHILVVTDGENTHGYSPADVAAVLNRLPEDRRAALYFIAFDINAAQFKATRDAGALVLGAANERELQQTLDYVLSGKILVEQPAPAQK